MLLRGSPLTADQMGHSIVEAESKWDALCSARPEYFDGALLAVGGVARNGHGGVTLTFPLVRIGGMRSRMTLSTWDSDLWA